MATYINNIFNFGRRLPSPFDTIANKKIKVSSKYGDGTTSTLCSAMIKAIHAVCHCMDGSGEGAVGIIDHRTAAEYKSSASADAYHLVVYDSNTGTLLASVYDSNMETFENYALNSSGRDGAAVMMALFPMLMQDDEFKENFEAYQDELNAGYPHMDKATEYMALMCDNAYRRIKDDSCAAHIKVNVDKAGNLMRVSQTHLDSGSFTPTTVLAGEFKIFAQTGPAQIYSATETIDHVDFEGQYVLNKRTFSPQEAMLIPKLPEWYIIPKEVVDICKHAKATTGKSMQMRNFLLRGPAGTGKTMGAKAIAAGLGLPYMKYTCSANTEIFDFVGMIFPDSADESTGSAQLDAERETLMQMGGINYANVSKLMKLPDLDDMDYDPAGVYMALAGVENAAATSQDCMSIVLDRVTEKVRELSRTVEDKSSSGQTYRYVETDFIKALKHGYVIEIQEPSTILDNMAEKAACEELESERIRELNEAAQSISYGDIHSGVNIRVNRIASVDPELVEQYDAICNPLISISRQLQKSLLRQLKENRCGGKQTGLIMGRRLDAHALCRNDGKVFYKNNLPNEIPELAVGLLLDESGSMCSCDRCTYARAAAIILYDFCESLEIPVMVYGHSTDCYDGKNSVELYSYAEFNGFDNDDKYRLMDISARGSNRDGAALRYVAEALSKRSEAVKLLILVSDGQPADTGYYGTAAEEDLRGIKQEYQRKGILFVAAAIGNDKQNIERIYGDSFLDITDLNQLPTKLTGVVKRHIRV